MKRDIGADAAKLAGLQIDQLHRIRSGDLTLKHLEWFNRLSKCQRDALVDSSFESLGIQERWREENGVIYLSPLTSPGLSGPQWIERLEEKGIVLYNFARSVLQSPGFHPSPAGTVINTAVLKGSLFGGSERITSNIRHAAESGRFTNGQKLATPPPDLACLIRENFTNKELKQMGILWIVAMHESIKDSDGDPSVLGAGRDGDGGWLCAGFDHPGGRWHDGGAFAFFVPAS